MSFLKNYGATLLLLLGLVAGGVVGTLWSETAAALRSVWNPFTALEGRGGTAAGFMVGGMTGEILICAVLGLDPSFAATLLIIGTICDIPATLLNVSGNLVAPLLVHRLLPEKH